MPRFSPAVASDVDSAVVDKAIAWFVRLQSGQVKAEDRANFDMWLAASPQHELAWQRIQSLGGRVDEVPAAIGLKTLEHMRSRKMQRRSMLKALSLVLAGGGAAAWLTTETDAWQAATADYATATGQRRTVMLSDGTEIVMNTDSALNVRFDAHSRWVDLLRGEVCITTGAEPESAAYRPFRVRTEFGTLRALGTRFLVRLDASRAWLCVEQGAVEVLPLNGGSAIGRANETLRFDRGNVVSEEETNPPPAAWLDGVLLARDMPLARFLEELSRYRRGIITCDPAVAQLRVSGAYQTADPDKALALVASSLNLHLSYRTRFWVVVAAAQAANKNI